MIEQFEQLIDGFVQNEVGVSHQFIPQHLAAALKNNIEQFYREGKTADAGIGSAQHKMLESSIRRDKIYWIYPDTTNAAEKEFIELIEAFITYMNRTCYTGINAYEFHYAVYEAGSFYKRHRDRFKDSDARKFSLVSYLNDDWTEADGGQIVLYHKNGQAQCELPTYRKSVFFKSDDLEHEVLLAHRTRLSITGWLKRV